MEKEKLLSVPFDVYVFSTGAKSLLACCSFVVSLYVFIFAALTWKALICFFFKSSLCYSSTPAPS